MTALYVLTVILTGIVICQLIVIALLYRFASDERGKIIRHYEERIADLLDRIQAPSFAEYAGKVIREKMLERKKDEDEKPIEFVS